MTTVARLYRFRATHSLPDFPEPWCFPHQHDYTVEIVAEGGTDTDKLDRAFAAWSLDGSDMNDSFLPSTVENIATLMLGTLRHSVPAIIAVKVWEDRARWGRAQR